MRHAYTVTIRAAVGALLGIACLAPVQTMAGEPAWWTQEKRECREQGGTISDFADRAQAEGGCHLLPGRPTSPSYDDGAAQRAQEVAEAAAAAERQRQQEETARIERARLVAEQRKKEKDAAFIRDRDAAASRLKGSSSGAMSQLKGLAGTDNHGLKGSGFDQGGQLKSSPGADTSVVDSRNEPAGLGGKSDFKGAFAKPAPTVPSGDPNVVDARNVPSGLPKAVDNAIATVYGDAPTGVNDRVRKGFQAVMDRDWKVAKAWFEDALKRDPGNVGLKRLVALTDSSQQPAFVDVRNEPAGLGGRLDVKGVPAPTSQTKSTLPSTPQGQLQLPDPNDIRFLFPGLQAMKERESPVFKTLPDGRQLQLPSESDMEFLFPDAYPPSSKSEKAK